MNFINVNYFILTVEISFFMTVELQHKQKKRKYVNSNLYMAVLKQIKLIKN